MKRLSTILRLNSLSCLIFGALFIIAPVATAAFLGTEAVWIIRVVGFALLFNGLHLALASGRKKPSAIEIYYFSAGDLSWASLTLALVIMDVVIVSPEGVMASLAIACLVGYLGISQILILNRSENDADDGDRLPAKLTTFQAALKSWMALKLWIKIWLFGVNGAFLAAFIFWPDPLAVVAIAAYTASAPWIIAIVTAQRGFTRLLGLAHLIPWVPLVAYLVLRLSTDMAGPQLSLHSAPALYQYTLVLLGFVGICLAFDIVDIFRWFKGEKYRMGSETAAQSGASLPATT